MSAQAFKPQNMSEPQKLALLNLAAGRASHDGLNGRAAFGGHDAVLRCLAKFGFVAINPLDRKLTLTDAGRLAAERIGSAAP